MIARSPSQINERFAQEPRDIQIARRLAALSLIRPLVSCGRIGDIVGDQLVYDAPTAHGGSGGPVFNYHGEVIAVNSAFIDGFSGGSMGISVEWLRQLLDQRSSRPSRDSKYSNTSDSGETVLRATSK
jgi:S1-C subfamily serine protease